MPKNLIIDGKTLTGVTSLKAKDADTGNLVSFSDTSDATAIASDISAGKTAYVNGVKLDGTNTGVEANDLDGLVDGTLTKFVMPSGKTAISQYRFYQFTGLVSANLGGIKTIGNYAFDGCTKMASIVMPNTLTNIGSYACRSLGSGQSTTFDFTPTDTCTLGTYAFNSSKIALVSGKFSSIGTYALAACSSLKKLQIECSAISDYAFHNDYNITDFDVKANGSIGNYAFYNLYGVSSCNLDANSVITSLGNYAFSRFASNRANASENIIVFDLRKSTFTSVSQYCFGGDSSSTTYRNQYMKILFPKTVATINAYAFRYTDHCDFYFETSTPPTLSATTCWSNATNYNIFVPYFSANAYRTATNWTAQANYIKGYSEAGTFEVGATLPEISPEGYGLSWYSDAACTIPVTTVEDTSAVYFCTVGTEKLVYDIKTVTCMDCTVTITDGVNTYSAGDSVSTGTVLTITGTPTTEGYIPYIFKVNGVDFNSGESITVSDDIVVMAIYYDGHTIPVNPVFSENPWSIIFQIFRAGTASQFWSPGDTKPITLTNGVEMTIRIADMQTGRYALANGSGSSNGVLEFVEQFATTSYMNSSNTNSGGWANCYMKKTTMENCYNLLPADLQEAISEVAVLSGTGAGTTSGTSSSNNKLFLPSEWEIFGARSYSIGSSEGTPRFDYYRINNTSAARIKYRNGSAQHWWLRSPHSGYSNGFCMVYSNGGASNSDANYSYGVSPCFAI